MSTARMKIELDKLFKELKTEFNIELTTDEAIANRNLHKEKLAALSKRIDDTKAYREYLESKQTKRLVHYPQIRLETITEEPEQTISLKVYGS